MLALIDPRFEGDNFKTEISGVTEQAFKWHKEYPQFEYKLLPILPAAGYFISDPNLSSKSVKVELYAARPWKPIDTRPHLIINDSFPEWRDYFIQQFVNYWNLSKTPW